VEKAYKKASGRDLGENSKGKIRYKESIWGQGREKIGKQGEVQVKTF